MRNLMTLLFATLTITVLLAPVLAVARPVVQP